MRFFIEKNLADRKNGNRFAEILLQKLVCESQKLLYESQKLVYESQKLLYKSQNLIFELGRRVIFLSGSVGNVET